MKFSVKIPEIHFFHRFLPWQDTSSYCLAALRLFEFIWPLFPKNWGTIPTFSKSGFWRSKLISGSQFQSWLKTIHFKILIYSRNLKTKNFYVFQVNLSEISFLVLSTVLVDKTVFDFKVFTVGEIIRPGLTDFRAVLNCLSLIRPKNKR